MPFKSVPSSIPLSLLILVPLLHLAFLWSSQTHSPAPLSDSEEYLHASRNLFQEGILYGGDLEEPVREELYTRRPPLYPVLLGLTISLRSPLMLFILQALLSMGSMLLVFRIFSRQIHWDEKTVRKGGYSIYGYFVMLLLLLTPAQFIYSNRIMAEILFQMILVGLAWCVYIYFGKHRPAEQRSGKSGQIRCIWLFNLLLVLGMATKPVLYPFVIITVPISIFLYFRTRQRALILAALLPLLWIGIYSTRNQIRTGSPQYSSIQTANLVNYNLRYFIMGREGSATASQKVDSLYEVCEHADTYREKNQCLQKGVREVILDRPFRFGIFHLKGILRYFLDPGRFDLVTFFHLEGPDSAGFLQQINRNGIKGALSLLRTQGWGLMIALGGIFMGKLLKLGGFLIYLLRGPGPRYESLLRANSACRPFRIFLILLVGYLALATGPLGASRFFLPVELLIIGAAVIGWLGVFRPTADGSRSI